MGLCGGWQRGRPQIPVAIRATHASALWDLLLYAARRMIESPCHRAGTNDPRAGASSQMRYAPKQLTAASHQVSPDMMQPGRAAMMAGRLQAVRRTIFR